MNKLPKHVAVIMDGNGRWARERNLPRSMGHKAGGERAKEIVQACVDKQIEVLTLFAFGRENWKRPAEEVNYLMSAFFKALKKNTAEYHKQNVKFTLIGDIKRLNPELQKEIRYAEDLTSKNSGLQLNFAVNYSGRWDILTAAKKIGRQIAAGRLTPEDITEELFQSKLCLAGLPEPDLFIRTSGVQRISNFLLWQLTYTELYFTDNFWPDFTINDFNNALRNFAKIERRFGRTGEQCT